MTSITAERQTLGLIQAENLSAFRRYSALGFLASAYMLYSWAWNSVDVLRPYIAADLHLSLPQAGSLYSAQGLGALCGAVVIGQLADRFGRRNALMCVMVGYGVLLLSGLVVANYAQVLLQRCAMGFFMGSMYPITVGVYTGLFSPHVRGRVASVIMASSYLSISLLGVAATAAFKAHLSWHVLLWVGVLPVVLSPLALLIVPNDRRMVPFGGAATTSTAKGKLPISELFAPGVRRRTLMLATMIGLNFFAYQAFNGWATTYLKSVRHLGDADIGRTVTWMFAGSVFGSFAWGWVGDFLGRRISAVGFLFAAGLIGVYLFAPLQLFGLCIVAFLYGAALACSVVWGPWLAELYPAHLRSTAASIFNWGRIISFFAPLTTGAVAEHFGLASTMTIGSLVFVIAAGIWLALPETLAKRGVSLGETAQKAALI
jgi:MFS family permease